MRAKFINEAFTVESDPIKDMAIGWEEIIFEDVFDKYMKAHLAWDKSFDNDKRSPWLEYRDSFIGKTIKGVFWHTPEPITFKILKSFSNIEEHILGFSDYNEKKHKIIKSNVYYIK